MERLGKLDVGIIGYGFAGQLHKDALKNDERIGKITIVDLDSDKRNLANSQGLETRTSLQEMSEDVPELIIVAVPPSSNLATIENVVNLYKRPRGILIEKPLATTVQDAEEIERVLSHDGAVAMVALPGHGYHPEIKKASELVRDGVIGNIRTITDSIHLGGPDLPQRYLSKEYGGVVLLNGIHTADHLSYFSGQENWQVQFARMGNDYWNGESPDWGEALLTSDHIIAHASWLWPKDYSAEKGGAHVTLIGNKGVITINLFEGISIQSVDMSDEINVHNPNDNFETRHLPGYISQMKAFIDAVVQGENPPTSLSYAVSLQRIVNDIQRKATGESY